jgi:flavin reductase (DIM6/NTAB) family NADH-FMN oxidoreductase RutF
MDVHPEQEVNTVDEQAKKIALRKIPYGLFVLGVKRGDEVNASTVTWLSQCSLNPPLVMVALKVGTSTYEAVKSDRVFSVNVLGRGQQEVAAHFFKPAYRVGNKLGNYAYRTALTGAPLLEDAIAWWECQVRAILEMGDHHVVVGEVVEAGVNDAAAQPLLLSDTPWNYGG